MNVLHLCLLLTVGKLVDSIHPECAIISDLLRAKSLCYEKRKKESFNVTEKNGCPTEWDDIRCWPRADVGHSISVTCSEVFQHFPTKKGFIFRNCSSEGWTEPYPPYPEACGFAEDPEPEIEKTYYSTFKHVYTAGYSTSLISLITAIIIFTAFRKFHCTRNYIHINLFASFILRASAVFIKDGVLFADENMDHCSMSTVACKSVVGFFQFSILANFFWLLVEALYLQTLLAFTFVSQKKYFWWYILIGWGFPTAVMIVWVITRIYYDNRGCWDDNERMFWWIIKGPILVSVLVNFIIFINVIRILVQKLNTPAVGGNDTRHFMRLAKSTLFLIPLFGVHYVVFAFFPDNTGVDARLYIELGLGSFQGFVVALLYCFLNGEVQAEMKKRLGKCHSQGYLTFTQKRKPLFTESSTVTQLSVLEKHSSV
ncbi:vasoactive intestinal polypeptide receptor 1 [Amia ocellicauda]|uniref:vasoactive intestinal polypeptide receptor 1 n=1 Tax=Amia ocellicauda TaxID=2972642 RepID=UPI00346463E1